MEKIIIFVVGAVVGATVALICNNELTQHEAPFHIPHREANEEAPTTEI